MVVQVISQFLQVDFHLVRIKPTELFTNQKLKWVRCVAFLVEDLIAVCDEGVQTVEAEEKAGHVPKFEYLHFHFQIGIKLSSLLTSTKSFRLTESRENCFIREGR